MTNFLDFLREKEERIAITESISEKNMSKAFDLLTSLLKKHIDGKVLRISTLLDTKVNGKSCKSMMFIIERDKPQVLMLNWLNSGKANEVYSIAIFDNLDVLSNYNDKAKVVIYTMGASIVYFMPLIYHVINNRDYKLQHGDVKKYAKHILKESIKIFNIGALEYHIFENLGDDYVFNMYCENVSNRLNESELSDAKRSVRKRMMEVRPERKEKSDLWKNLEDDYYALAKAIRGGAETLDDLDVELKSDVMIEIIQSKSESKAEHEIEELKEDPEVVWKEMRQYVKMVMKGLNPSVILCGAPGAGKTFRVKKELKGGGYSEGKNLCTIKGKCSPRQLYLSLYQFKEKGDIILIDDADGLVGPKAPEDVINILKGALDSTSDDEGRLVSYMVTGKLTDEEGTPIPKKFYYNGGVIIITNYNAGQLDTALKGRSYVQDIHFSIDDMMAIIKRVMPEMGDGKISDASKQKAFDYITKLSKDKNNNIEISMRTFNICATLYESAANDDDFTDEDTDRMIKKLLQLQAARGGKKY